MKTKIKDINVNLKKLELKENDLLIVKVEDNIELDGAEVIGEAIAESIKQLGTQCGMLVISPAMDLFKVDESFMATFGWYKKHTAEDAINELF